jgi:mono/diheme cytochrome c family protein
MINQRNSLSARIATHGIALLCLLGLPTAGAFAQDGSDIERGKYLFTDGYKCYACHGFDAQTGSRRLVPLNYSVEGFTAFVQNSPLPQMPAFADVPAQDLASIFAYIQTIPADAPNVEDIELLSDIGARQRAEFEN